MTKKKVAFGKTTYSDDVDIAAESSTNHSSSIKSTRISSDNTSSCMPSLPTLQNQKKTSMVSLSAPYPAMRIRDAVRTRNTTASFTRMLFSASDIVCLYPEKYKEAYEAAKKNVKEQQEALKTGKSTDFINATTVAMEVFKLIPPEDFILTGVESDDPLYDSIVGSYIHTEAETQSSETNNLKQNKKMRDQQKH